MGHRLCITGGRHEGGQLVPVLAGEILVQTRGLARRASASSQSENTHHPDGIPHGKGENVARPHPRVRFGHHHAIDPNLAPCRQLCSKATGFAKSGMPKPFVEAKPVRAGILVGHDLSFICRSAAKGELLATCSGRRAGPARLLRRRRT